MAKNDACGIYLITCRTSGKCYVGSSVHVRRRWQEHQRLLRAGKHPGTRLQRAWLKYGESAFVFEVLELCTPETKLEREQHHIDALAPGYNSMPIVGVITAEMREKIAAATQARVAAITQCPQGHAYDAENSYVDPKGGRRCKRCNAERVRTIFLSESPEQREVRRQKMAAYHVSNLESRKAQTLIYRLANKEQKSAYDRAYKAAKKAARAGLTA